MVMVSISCISDLLYKNDNRQRLFTKGKIAAACNSCCGRRVVKNEQIHIGSMDVFFVYWGKYFLHQGQ